MKKIFCLDTNVLLYDSKAIFAFEENDVVIPFKVLEELDSKKNRSDEVGLNARVTNRVLEDARKDGNLKEGVKIYSGGTLRVESRYEKIYDDVLLAELDLKPDNIIIGTALYLKQQNPDSEVILITKDISMRIKCDIVGVRCDDYLKHQITTGTDDIYTGVSTIEVSQKVIDALYSDVGLPIEDYDIFNGYQPNEILVLKSFGAGSSCLARVKEDRVIRIGKTKNGWLDPKNKEQQFALELLQDDDIKFVSLIGQAGTGKTLLAIAAALEQALGSAKKYEKIIISRPIQPVGKDIGYLPGSKDEKMEPWIQPIVDNLKFLFRDQNESYLRMLFDNKTIETEAITYIRGRSLPNSIIIIDESQNLTVSEVKTILTRVGEGSKVILTGDIHQIDNNIIDSLSNGLTYSIEKFKDKNIAGHITLLKGERSELSELASQIL